MLTFTRTLKDGTAVEFEFIQNGDKFELDCSEIIFDFTLHKKYISFNIDTRNLTNLGYGTALMSIVLEYAKANNFEFVCGWLSTADRDNGNWKISIPFYLKQLPNAYLIERETTRYIHAIYDGFNSFEEFFNAYEHYHSYDEFVTNNTDGFIIFPLVAIGNCNQRQNTKKNDLN